MNIKEEYILISGFLIFAILLVFIIKNKVKQNNTNSKTYENPTKTVQGNTEQKEESEKKGINFPLRKGSGFTGTSKEEKDAVKSLQLALNKMARGKDLNTVLTVDGAFGSKTEVLLLTLTKVDYVTKENFDYWTKQGLSWTI